MGQNFEMAMGCLWDLLADDKGNSRPLVGICEEAGAALRRGWDSERPSAAEPVEPAPYTPPRSGYAVEHALREEVARLEHRLQEAMERVEDFDEIEGERDRLRRVMDLEKGRDELRAKPVRRKGECVTGDGAQYDIDPIQPYPGTLGVTLTDPHNGTEIAVNIPRAQVLAALGLRGDL